MSHACHRFWNCYKPSRCSLFTRCTIPCACHAKGHLNVQKCSVPLSSFTFDLDMCFAPQRRALFRHINFQKWFDTQVLCTFWLGNVLRATTASTFSTYQLPKVLRTPEFFHFWLGNVLRATTACTFSTSELPKAVRTRCALYILTWKCASRHNGVHFFISHLASWLRTRRFSEPTFPPSGAPNHWKNTVFRNFPLLWSSLFGSSPLWIFPPLLFHLSILSEVWLLNFLRLYIYIYIYYTYSTIVYRIMLCYVILGYIILYYIIYIYILYCFVSYHVDILYTHTIVYHTIHIISYHIISYHIMSCHVISYHVISLYDIILHRIVLYHDLLYYIKVYYLLLHWLSYIQVQWPSSTVGPSAKLLCYYVLLLQYCSMVRHSESVYQYHEQFPKSTAYSISALTPWDATSVWSPFT